MKKTMRWIAVALVALMLCMTLVGCAKTLKGTYITEADGGIFSAGTSYTFEGDSVTIEVKGGLFGIETSTSFDGEYEIYTDEQGVEKIKFTFASEDAKKYSGTFDFEEIDDGIKIGGIIHNKK